MFNIKSYRPWLVLLYLIIMFANSLFSFIDVPIKDIWKYDKLIHYIEYYILGLLVFHALYENNPTKKELIFSMFMMSFIPIIDESIQYFTPNRIPSLYDALSDYAGFYSGSLLYHLIYKCRYG